VARRIVLGTAVSAARTLRAEVWKKSITAAVLVTRRDSRA
jgi:hypothetical protein